MGSKPITCDNLIVYYDRGRAKRPHQVQWYSSSHIKTKLREACPLNEENLVV